MNRAHEVVVVVVELCDSRFSLFPRDCRVEVKLGESRAIPSHEADEGAIVCLAEVIFHSVAEYQQQFLQPDTSRGRAQTSHDRGFVRCWGALDPKWYNHNQPLNFR